MVKYSQSIAGVRRGLGWNYTGWWNSLWSVQIFQSALNSLQPLGHFKFAWQCGWHWASQWTYIAVLLYFPPEMRKWCSRAASSADKVNLNMKILNYFGALGVWRGTRTCSRVHWGHMPHGSDYSYCTESKHFSCPKLSKYRKLWAWVRHISYSSPSLLNAHQAGHQPQKSNKWEIAI